VIVNGHPDPRPERFCAGLANAVECGAQKSGWKTERFTLGSFSSVFGHELSQTAADERERMARAFLRADQVTIIFPLWLNRPPAPLTSILKNIQDQNSSQPIDRLTGLGCKTRLIVTMEMPAFAHRPALGPSSQNSLTLPGIQANEIVFIGGVHTLSHARRTSWLNIAEQFGRSIS
jgi:putative NADPH-quinone reductase